jgi:3-dehydroquinate synthase II
MNMIDFIDPYCTIKSLNAAIALNENNELHPIKTYEQCSVWFWYADTAINPVYMQPNEPGEGMLIGSYSKSMFLVHSESLESEYVASRPFRVNAGPVQAYVMVPGNKTRYLSELVAGDEVLIVNTKGETRTAYVGRSKIERRPLILLEAEYEGQTIRTLLQNAETIRIVDENDEPLSVADVKPGDRVKVYIETSARHFGIAIDETIIEQ